MSELKNDNVYYVYEWYNVDTGEVFYVGKGKGNRYLNLDKRNDFFKNYYNKYKKSCKSRIIFDELNEQEAFNLETKTIRQKREIGEAKCNLSDGGEGSSFGYLSEKAKVLYFAIISSNRKGKSSAFDLRRYKWLAITECVEKYNIYSHTDILSMSEKEIENIYNDYIELSEIEMDNLNGYKLFCETVMDGYDSMDDFWESNM